MSSGKPSPSFRFQTEACGFARTLVRALFHLSREEQDSLSVLLGIAFLSMAVLTFLSK